MGKRRTVTVRIDEDVWEGFQKWVVELHGQKYGNLGREVEEALKYHADRDRFKRIDDKLDRVLSQLGDAHTHMPSESMAKVNDIVSRLRELDRLVIPTDEVRRVIDEEAGSDERTVRKYERQMKRHGMAYEHPSDSNVWTLDRDTWLGWAVEYHNNNPTVTRADILEEYPIQTDEIERLATEALA